MEFHVVGQAPTGLNDQKFVLTSCDSSSLVCEGLCKNKRWRIDFCPMVRMQILDVKLSHFALHDEIPQEWILFEVENSPMVTEYGGYELEILQKCHHYVFRFENKVVEVLSQGLEFQELPIESGARHD